MKIAMFSDCFHPVVNGVVTSMDILRKQLQAAGHEVELYVPGPAPEGSAEPGVVRFASVAAPFHDESRFSFPWPLRSLFRLGRQRPDVIHVHTPFNLGLLGIWLARRMGIPYVFTHHTLWEEYVHYVPLVNKRLLRRVAIGLCRGLCNGSGGVVAPSAEVRDRLLEQGVTQRVEIIPTGIDLEVFAQGNGQRVRGELGIPDDVPLAVYAGRMGKEKSLDFLLRAFAQMAAWHPSARLLMVGGGPEKENLEALARSLGLGARVHFTGYVDRNRLVDYYRAGEVFVFASVTETQGLVSLEAQASDRPVVAVRASGSSEVVADGISGFLVPQEVEAFASATLRVLTDEALRQRLTQGARAQAFAFSAERMGERMLELYQGARQQI